MLVEHTFVTTMEDADAVRYAGDFLQWLGFRIVSAADGSVEAIRGRKHPNSRKLAQLPQSVKLLCDRGRFSVAAAVTPRGGKDLPVHANMMAALTVGLELLVAMGRTPEEAAAEWHAIESGSGNLWSVGDKIGLGCLIAIGVLVVLSVTLGLLLAD